MTGEAGLADPPARASRTQDLLVPGLGGWSARRTRAIGVSQPALLHYSRSATSHQFWEG